MFRFTLKTKEQEMVDITDSLRDVIYKSRLNDGFVVVYVPHTTAGVTINEAADPSVQGDILFGLSKAFPDRPEFRHAEGNSSAHLRASAVGSSVTVLVENGSMILGNWQGIFFCEFDGPRTRSYFVKTL
ncbi:MAG: secondary thiamine-phosphate synthase enzyme YjbQ [Deltaproteobacteria bacterium]|jgi:secondary thiamine-phosphate synthase enzyme|nr:secondary thiamine-phosphate synthase enzyme YjbQ [Deltaproteobacteria bacterium]